jgi:hypothetical protein
MKVCISICLPACLSNRPSICLYLYTSFHPSTFLSDSISSVSLYANLTVCLFFPSVCLPVHLSAHLFIIVLPSLLSVHLSIRFSLSVCPSLCQSATSLFIFISVCLPVFPSVHLSTHLSICLCEHLYVCLPSLSVSPSVPISVHLQDRSLPE